MRQLPVAARQADVCVAVVGDRAALFGLGTCGEGCDAEDLSLPGVQGELVEALPATGTPVVLLVVSGRPYALGAYADRAAAVVQAFFPGEEGGPALAGVLSGRINPSGKLPVQVPRTAGGQPGTYLHAPLGGNTQGVSNLDPTPAYPFGHGRSYTTFTYGGFEVAEQIATDGDVEISCRVRNTDGLPGTEVIQLYTTDPVAQLPRPVTQLTGLARVRPAAGEERRVTFRLHADRLAYTGPDLHRIVEPDEITVRLGASSTDIRLTGTIRLTGPTRRVGHVKAPPARPMAAEPTSPSDPFQGAVRTGGQFHFDRVAGEHHTAFPHDAHDSGLAHDVPRLVTADDLFQQPILEVVDLQAGIAEAGDFQDRGGADAQQCADRQSEQVDTARGDVLAEFAGRHLEPFFTDLGEELFMNEVDLAQIRLGGILRDTRTVLDRHTGVHVSLHTEPGEQSDAVPVRLGERVIPVAADRRHSPAHTSKPPRR